MPDHQVTISTSRLQMERPNSSNYILIVCEHTEFFPFDGFFTAWIPELKSGEKKNGTLSPLRSSSNIHSSAKIDKKRS